MRPLRSREGRYPAVSLLLRKSVEAADPALDRGLIGKVDAVLEHGRGHRLGEAEVTGVARRRDEPIGGFERRFPQILGRLYLEPSRRGEEAEHLGHGLGEALDG